MQDRLLDVHWHGFWTWVVAIPLIILLLLLWLVGLGPGRAGCCASSPSPVAAIASAPAEAAPAPFHFSATRSGVGAEGEPAHLPAWWSQRERLPGLLAQGNGLELAGSGNHATLVGDVNTQEQREAVGRSIQALLGPDIALDNQLHVAEASGTATQAASATEQVAPSTVPTATLYFALASSALPADSAQVLAPVVDYLKAHPEAQAVISGYHDASGNADLNAKLAKDRATAVRAQLLLDGVAMERIALRKPQVTTGSGDPAAARRVEVSIAPQ